MKHLFLFLVMMTSAFTVNVDKIYALESIGITQSDNGWEEIGKVTIYRTDPLAKDFLFDIGRATVYVKNLGQTLIYRVYFKGEYYMPTKCKRVSFIVDGRTEYFDYKIGSTWYLSL